MLVMVMQNVVNNPDSEKHRKVNTSSARFHDLFSSKGPAAELLKLAGFQYQEPNFIYASEQGTDSLQIVRDLLQEGQRSVEQVWAARPSSVEARDEAPIASCPTTVDAAPCNIGNALEEEQPISNGPPLPAPLPGAEALQSGTGPALSVISPGMGMGSTCPGAVALQGGLGASSTRPQQAQAARPWMTNSMQKQAASRPSQGLQSQDVVAGATEADSAPPALSAPTAPVAGQAASSSAPGPALGAAPGGVHPVVAATPAVAHPAQSPAHPAESPAAVAAVAHPAESQDVSPAMAHPAESEGFAPPQPHVAVAHPAEGAPLPSPQQVAHPAEGGSAEEQQPQSGG